MQTWGVIVCFAALAGTQVFAEEPLAFSEDVRDLSGARIVSGWDAEEGQIPWQLSLRMVSPVGAVSSCGGSIIHPNWGITAAHCTATRVTMVIRAGAVSLTRPELIFETTEYWNHPLYIDALQTIVQPHDISILKFPLAISFSDRVQPIRLQRDQDRNRNYGGVRLEASGWGRTWTNGASPDHLQWVYLTGDTNLACWFAFGGSSIIVDSTICASAYNVSSQSTCQGDSGGPLVELEEDGKYTQVGIASFVSSAGCHADLPAGFIRPGHYHSWYTDITGLDFSSWDYEEITTEAPTTEADSSSESDSSESNEDSEESTEEPTTEAASSSESNEDSEETTESASSSESNEDSEESTEEPTTEAASTEETTTEAASEEEVTETTEAATSEATTEAASEEEVTETTEAATTEATTEAASEEEVTETTEAATSEATTEAASEEEVTETTEEATETTEEATETTEAATSEATTEAASEEEVTETTEEATETTEEATETTEAATSEATTEAASEEEVTETTEEATQTTEEATETTEAATSEATTEAATEEEGSDAATTEATPEGSTETEEGGAEDSRNVFYYFRNLLRF